MLKVTVYIRNEIHARLSKGYAGASADQRAFSTLVIALAAAARAAMDYAPTAFAYEPGEVQTTSR
jgi:hypothetical protein